ncbi:glutathione S-transferase family protein [Caenispirillum salinarum]|uniref:glutathione S-transferase family protein n=1 Tax=Caenispirillum salinarum TaxID=859058 RepID=UPI00384D3223
MGLLIDGQWHDQWYDTKSTGGRFKRQESAFRDRVGTDRFPAEAGRYHLYVSLACPWAHRTLIFRALKGLEDAISVSVVDPLMLDNGWEFGDDGDPLYGLSYLREIYTKADPHYTGRVTVPVLWDRERETIVNNESAELIRMLNADFGALASGPDFYPEPLREEIDAVNARVYDAINNGVYKTGFATTQEAYEEAYDALFAALDWVEERLSRHRYVVGDTLTEADWRLFTTLVRFDPVYVGHFKCNRNRIADFPNMLGYLRELYQVPGVAQTVSLDHIKRHYYASHTMINPTGIVPKGPAMDLTLPHGRG